MMTATARRTVFGLLAAIFGAAAAFHLAAVVRPSLDPGAPAPRHATFVAINLGCALGFVFRPKWFVAAFGLLVVQQLFSHGGQALREWQGAGRLDVASLGVLAVMPIALALLIVDARSASKR
jgi:dolichyl-phosphate-mannose--protein O-mannosyl transferase